MNELFSQPGGRVFFLGPDGKRGTAVRLRLESGGEAVVDLKGAQVVSWVGSNWQQHLHCPPQGADGSKPLQCAPLLTGPLMAYAYQSAFVRWL